jgi:hypothetical protein
LQQSAGVGSLNQAIDDIATVELSDRHELMKTETGSVKSVIAATFRRIRDRTNLPL